MLSALHVRNYALIKHLEIEFRDGFSIITGETGAGKSILMGALSLLLGNRADTSVLMDKSKKCFVEGSFDISQYGYHLFFSQNEIDYDDQLIIRREIAPGGKSRAFINDSPVNLNLLRDLGLRLVDIHSQHQNLHLGDHLFQLTVVDTVAGNGKILDLYTDHFRQWTDLLHASEEIKGKARQAQSDLDYYTFQFGQLDEARLVKDEQDTLEQDLQMLEHATEIKQNLLKVVHMITEQENSVGGMLQEILHALESIREVYPGSEEMGGRISSVLIELKDIATEAERNGENIEVDPGKEQMVRERLDLIYSLLQKHSAQSVEELISIREDLNHKIQEISSYEDQISEMEKELLKLETELGNLADKLSASRKKIIPGMVKEVSTMLQTLGIPNAGFRISQSGLDDFTATGRDEVEFLFSANKQVPPQEISKVASGGELSRLMLSIKSLLGNSLELPTIIFDEVDAGVSGEIAEKVGTIMKAMSAGKQVINITHLPQVAGKGDYHYLVYKYDRDGATRTDIKLLNDKDRVLEIAKMLSGEELTEAAISNARELLN